MLPLFNTDGFLPVGQHIVSEKSIHESLVIPFSDPNRRYLFDSWQRYNRRLKDLLNITQLHQWIDGSFVTIKIRPNDIDLVTFVPYIYYEPAEEQLIEEYSTITLHDHGLDAYLCPIYPTDHPDHELYLRFRTTWQTRFQSVKGLTLQKGFIETTI